MTDLIGRGTIELVGDARKLKASIEDAKKSVRTLGEGQKDITKSAQRSIDQYIEKLQLQTAVLGKSRDEAERFKLALRGASNEQINSATAALAARDAYEKNRETVAALKTGFIALFAAVVTGALAAAAAFDQLVKKAGSFQDMAEKIGDSAEAIASLAVAAAVGGVQMETVAAAAVKLTKNLTGVDDESKDAGAAIEALGLNLADFKKLKASDQIEAVAKALDGFEESSAKAAVAVALFGKTGADLLPFLKELAKENARQVILTEEQIQLADQYADKQAKTRAELELYAQAIATEMIPAYTDLSGAFVDILKGIAGVKDGVKGLSNGKEIQAFADDAVKVLALMVDAFDGVIRAAQVTQITIGGTFATVFAIASHDFGLLKNIAIESGRQMDAVLNRPTLRAALAARRAAREAGLAEAKTGDESEVKKKLKFSGAVDKDKAAALAKAQLNLDLEEIRKTSEATLNAFSNAEKILEAKRAAALVNDEDYFKAKLAFIQLNSQEQERALQEEIDRLEEEKAVGKDRLENQKRIVEAKAKLDKVRADAVVNTVITNTQEEASARKLAQAYIDASEAADQYIDSIKRRTAAELSGIGRGQKFRDEEAGRIAIQDKLIAERARIERDRRNNPQIAAKVFDDYLAVAEDTFRKEVALYEERTLKIRASEEDWTNGASEAFANYIEQARNVAKQTEEFFTSAFKGAEDALVSFVQTGKLDFRALADSIIADLIRIQIRKMLAGIFSGITGGGFFGGGGAGAINTGGGDLFANPLASAAGGHRDAGQVLRVGERGPELFIPDSPGTVIPNHALGGDGNMRVEIVNQGSPKEVESAQPRVDVDGMIVRVILRDQKEGGPISRGFSNTFGLRRSG